MYIDHLKLWWLVFCYFFSFKISQYDYFCLVAKPKLNDVFNICLYIYLFRYYLYLNFKNSRVFESTILHIFVSLKSSSKHMKVLRAEANFTAKIQNSANIFLLLCLICTPLFFHFTLEPLFKINSFFSMLNI